MTTVRLTHFQRGQVDVVPVLVDGRREWIDPTRPMMKSWPPCYFNEPPDVLDTLWLVTVNASSRAKEGFGAADRLSAIA